MPANFESPAKESKTESSAETSFDTSIQEETKNLCVYRGTLPEAYIGKNFPLGTIDDKGNCTFTYNGNTYVEGEAPATKPTRPITGARSADTNESKVNDKQGNSDKWTEEAMKNAKPTPMPVLDPITKERVSKHK